MKEINVLSWCDECDTLGDHTAAIDSIAIALDGRPTMTLDLCEPHAKALRSIGELIDSHGARVEAKGPTASKPGPATNTIGNYPCPLCSMRLSARSGVLSHLVSGSHGIDRIEASRMTPPAHDAVECDVCGFVSQSGVGINVHFKNQHPGMDATFHPFDPDAPVTPAAKPRRARKRTTSAE